MCAKSHCAPTVNDQSIQRIPVNRHKYFFSYLLKLQQNRRCTCSKILRCVRVKIAAVVKQVLHILCVCSHIYSAFNAHAPYYTIIGDFSASTIFFRIISQTAWFPPPPKKKSNQNTFENKICILVLSTTFVWKISHSNKNSARYHHKCRQVFV